MNCAHVSLLLTSLNLFVPCVRDMNFPSSVYIKKLKLASNPSAASTISSSGRSSTLTKKARIASACYAAGHEPTSESHVKPNILNPLSLRICVWVF
jgi:hypothetical protein